MEICMRMMFLVLFFFLSSVLGQDTIFPAIIAFGDSGTDVGNNNHRQTPFKSNFFPYGENFANHEATGRFTDGKTLLDLTAETLGFVSPPVAYLSPEASGKNLRFGASFATAGTGYYDKTSTANEAIPLSQQLRIFVEYKDKLEKTVGKNQTETIMSEALFLLTAGIADFIQNYYFYPDVRKEHTLDSFSKLLLGLLSSFVKKLHDLGARRIGVTNLSPLGCLPGTRTLLKFKGLNCDEQINQDAVFFNRELNATVDSLKKELSGLKMIAFDIYEPLLDLVSSPAKYGMAESRRTCCQTGRDGGKASVLCRRKLPRVCANSSAHVFFDAVHLSEAANKMMSGALLIQGISLL